MDDAEAVRRAIAGDERGFEHLFTHHYSRVVAICRGYPAVGMAEADDAAQDVFVRAFRALPSLREGQHFGRWVLTIAHNRCRTLSARAGKRADAMRAWLDEMKVRASADTGGVDSELVEAVFSTITDERHRRVARMYWLEGYTSGEISRLEGVPISTVTTWMSRLSARVRARLMADALAGSDGPKKAAEGCPGPSGGSEDE